ncbi:MAG: toll/interleukin-1 receptor domain-containing protein [Acetobacter sp.]|nr:toll/interleukin-1 receptor domain-containing protein [Bacteroides sp.]MCM1341093.1 toll/interleukin-1 receptor domain-containing protein [Acetobacter sp.]MCM1433574.1 toll/interleukin-1 receptor domain-containing protein [Clostridiales bacterium]
MNVIKTLSMEISAIKNVLNESCYDEHIGNFIDELEIAIVKEDTDTIKYCVSQIFEWFDMNKKRVEVRFKDEHELYAYNRILKVLNDVYYEFNPLAFVDMIEEPKYKAIDETPMIFLSHSSKDTEYGDAIRDFITGLGVKNDQLIYSSHQLHKVPLGENIFNYLRQSFEKNIFVIILWSDNYLESTACIKELGAAWVTQKDYANIYVPDFDLKSSKYRDCDIDPSKLGIELKDDGMCKTNIIELKNKIQELFDLKDDEKNSSFLIDRFMNSIK